MMYTRIAGIKFTIEMFDEAMTNPDLYLAEVWELSRIGNKRQDRVPGVLIKGYFQTINPEAFPKNWTVQLEQSFHRASKLVDSPSDWTSSASYLK